MRSEICIHCHRIVITKSAATIFNHMKNLCNTPMCCFKCSYRSESQRLLIKHVIKKHPKYILENKQQEIKDQDTLEQAEGSLEDSQDTSNMMGIQNRTILIYKDFSLKRSKLIETNQSNGEITKQSKYKLTVFPKQYSSNISKSHSSEIIEDIKSFDNKLTTENGSDINRKKEYFKIIEDSGKANDEIKSITSDEHEDSQRNEHVHFTCNFRNASFNNIKQHNYHLEVHYNVKDENRYHCDVCGINFHTKHEMKEHKRTHFYRYNKNKKVKFGRHKNKNYQEHMKQEKSCFEPNCDEFVSY